MSYPKRADHFRQWADMMLKQALVPDRLEYKSNKGGATLRTTRKKRFLGRKRRNRRIRRNRD